MLAIAFMLRRGEIGSSIFGRIQDLEGDRITQLLDASRWLASPITISAISVLVIGIAAASRTWSYVIATFAVPLSFFGGWLVDLFLPTSVPSDAVRQAGAGRVPALAVLAASFALVALVGHGLATARDRRDVRYGAAGVVTVALGFVGVGSIWRGLAGPLDVAAAYLIGTLFLLGALAIQHRLTPAVDGLPFVHAGEVPHDETRRHAHALTSTILFDGERVAKIYRPGFFPRALYWLSFQAPFAYEANEIALRASLHRRNLAGLLTEYWYGRNLVGEAIAVERIDGRLALISTLIPGTEPKNHQAAREFLFDLSNRFDESGLPTWQIDPRQPRSFGNILEGADGSYTVIDLESGLVSPLASPRAWWRALRRALVPFYDDVYFDLTRRYILREEAEMRARLGDRWLVELADLVDRAEAEAWFWHQSEPRLWSWLARALQPELGTPAPEILAKASPPEPDGTGLQQRHA